MTEDDPSQSRGFPCRQCGARLTFAPGTDVIRCGHCGTENKIEADLSPIEELDFRAALKMLAGGQGEAAIEEARTITCESCSAEFTFDPHVRAEGCPYCGGAIVNEPHSHRLLRPRALVPFQVPAADARERLKAWLGSLWFAPSGVKEYAQQQDKLTGVYVPYWTFDAETQSTYFGERGIAHQVPRTFITRIKGRAVRKTQYVTEIRWRPVRGRVARFFDDVLVLASRTLPDHVVEKLGTWQLGALTPYQDEYLSGFRSEAYQVGLEDGFANAKQIMDRQIRSDVAFDIGGDAQRIHQVDTRFGDIRFKHILLPIWSAAYRYNGKAYRFVVNGQTGEVQGERPYSTWKIAVAVLLGLIVAGAFAYIATNMQ
ncbi:MAG: primosomal protein N' (replication factor Y) - superfamily II helicase [Hyphomicrobiales bacterium]|nr:primosomal protein N' (replication factor Y) - superfamily II helicase [Hyphomicrobiales bacterium]